MTRLDQLSEIAARNLGGLNADARLYQKIRTAADQRPAVRWLRIRPVLVSSLAAALCLCVGVWIAAPQLFPHGATEEASSTLLGSKAAGDSVLPTPEGARMRALDVPVGSITVGDSQGGTATYRNLFAPERSGNFPVVILSGAAYRMLISPTNMSDSLLGDSLGDVSEYTLEPALSNGGIVSNIVSAGNPVYAVRDMPGAMVAAYVKGSLRVFQRVSFSGKAVLGQETLQDTLAAPEHVIAMELTDAGVVDDPAAASDLMRTLLDNAEYESASVGSDDTRSLLIALDNGLLMQLMVGEDTVSACGTWSCPEFFQDYEDAVQPN